MATAAVSLAPTLAELPSVAAEVVRIAFRLGVHVDEVSENLEPRDLSGASPDTWAAVIPGISPDDVKRELEAHREKEVGDFHATVNRFYILGLYMLTTCIEYSRIGQDLC